MSNRSSHVMKVIVKAPIHVYRKFISPLKPPTCRFYPTCSAYGLEAIDKHGVMVGSWLAVKRICRCHPFHPGGIDYVPEPRGKRQADDRSQAGRDAANR